MELLGGGCTVGGGAGAAVGVGIGVGTGVGAGTTGGLLVGVGGVMVFEDAAGLLSTCGTLLCGDGVGGWAGTSGIGEIFAITFSCASFSLATIIAAASSNSCCDSSGRWASAIRLFF